MAIANTASTANKNDGGRDMRTPAELAIAPDEPVSREPAPPTKKLSFLDKAKRALGTVSTAISLGGASINAYKKTFQQKDQLTALSTSVTQTLTSFDVASKGVLRGTIPQQDTIIAGLQQAANTSATAFPSATEMVQISGMPPGFVTSAAQLAEAAAVLAERKRQLQNVQQSLEKKKNDITTGTGARVQENTARTTYPKPSEIGAPSVAPLAEGGDAAAKEPALADKQKSVSAGNAIASGKPSFWSRFKRLADFSKAPGYNSTLNVVFTDKSRQAGWSEPAPPYAAQYPYNTVVKTSSGHIVEYDNTPGAERIHIFHRSGSFIEMHPNGTVVYKSFADGYTVTHGNQYVKVDGSCHVSVEGDVTLYAKNKVDIKSENDVSIHTTKDFNVFAEGNIALRSKNKTTVDGSVVDLRYVKLGEGMPVAPVPGGVAPLVDLKALAVDFPLFARAITLATAEYKGAIAKSAAVITTKMGTELAAAAALATPASPSAGTTAMATKILSATKDTLKQIDLVSLGAAAFLKVLNAKSEPIPADRVPKTSPLANPLIYNATTQAAVNYRAVQLDTPEEMRATDLYQAHLDTRKALKDVANTYMNVIGGAASQPNTNIIAPAILPLVDFLNRDTYRGVYTFTPSAALANTSFTVADLVDSLSRADVANFAATDSIEPSDTGITVNGEPDATASTTSTPNTTSGGAGGDVRQPNTEPSI